MNAANIDKAKPPVRPLLPLVNLGASYPHERLSLKRWESDGGAGMEV